MPEKKQSIVGRFLTKYRGVYQRNSGIHLYQGKPDFCFDIAYRVDGKLKWEKVGWASEGYSAKLADQIRTERIRSIRHGLDLPKQKSTIPYFKDVSNKYIEWAKDNKSRSGREDYYVCKNHLCPRFDNKRMNEITSFDLEKMKSDLTKQGLSPGSVKHCLVVVRQIFNKATLWGVYQGNNPIKGIKLPTLQNQRGRFLSYEEANLLMEELNKKSKQLHDMALLSLHCGLRAGEIFNLKGQDLDFENGLINISEPKNKENRKAFMTMAVKKMLLDRKPDSPDDYVFKDNKRERIKVISKAFRRVIKHLKFNEGIIDHRQKIVFHSLRHTFASWLALQGETLLTIKELLGHKTLMMTIRYAHLIPDHKRKAILKLENDHKKNNFENKKIVNLDKSKTK
jgi:integrase